MWGSRREAVLQEMLLSQSLPVSSPALAVVGDSREFYPLGTPLLGRQHPYFFAGPFFKSLSKQRQCLRSNYGEGSTEKGELRQQRGW